MIKSKKAQIEKWIVAAVVICAAAILIALVFFGSKGMLPKSFNVVMNLFNTPVK